MRIKSRIKIQSALLLLVKNIVSRRLSIVVGFGEKNSFFTLRVTIRVGRRIVYTHIRTYTVRSHTSYRICTYEYSNNRMLFLKNWAYLERILQNDSAMLRLSLVEIRISLILGRCL